MNADLNLITGPPVRTTRTKRAQQTAEPWAELTPWLAIIDDLLQKHLACQQQRGDDRFDIQGILRPSEALDTPVSSLDWLITAHTDPPIAFPVATGRLAHVVKQFALSPVEVGALMLSLLPLFEPRYGAIIAYLQGEEPGNWPSIDFACLLLTRTASERVALRAALWSHEAPLRRHGLVLSAERSGRVSQRDDAVYLRPSESVFLYLTGQPQILPKALVDVGDWLTPAGPDPRVGLPDWQAFGDRLADWCWGKTRSATPIVLLQGGHGRESLLAYLAAEAHTRAFVMNLEMLPDDEPDAWPVILAALHVTRLTGATLVLRQFAAFELRYPRLLEALDGRVANHGQPVIALTSEAESVRGFAGLPRLRLSMPARSHNADVLLVAAGLADVGHKSDTSQLSAMLARTRINPDVLTQTVSEADGYRQQRGTAQHLSELDVYTALRVRAQQHFGALAQRIEPRRRLDDLIVGEPLLEQLREILAAMRQRETLLEQGFAAKIAYGTGISALFYGDSGTGKSMAAEVLAAEMGRDLIRVDLSTVVNKYIGETEKNLSKIFDMATADTGVLLFDEADALFGKRSEVKDAHDRHANIEVSYLLQRLEHYPGLVVLSTNNRGHLDDAFTRRLTFMTRFESPDATLRERMWRSIWPQHVAVSEDIDWTHFARNVELTGAGIRNVALLASWLAAEREREVRASDIERAIRRELGKTGRIMPRL
ncbi:ATP-binding protein [Burkholderia sp. SIMBA_062]|uniref:ATP-binding protein n=1 Tax=Burkholderia sp. SIMBA_062 TaxID=3085803 RepID=UPI00397CB9B8